MGPGRGFTGTVSAWFWADSQLCKRWLGPHGPALWSCAQGAQGVGGSLS